MNAARVPEVHAHAGSEGKRALLRSVRATALRREATRECVPDFHFPRREAGSLGGELRLQRAELVCGELAPTARAQVAELDVHDAHAHEALHAELERFA